MIQTIPYLFQLAALIGSSVTSFLIAPPNIYPPEEELAVRWINIFSFLASLTSIVIARTRKVKYTLQRKIIVRIWLGISLVLAAGTYEQLYTNYSISCFGETRVVISRDPVKSENYEYWKYRWGDLAVKKFIEANRCDSTKVWPVSKLLVQYYGMQLAYFLVIISFTLLSCSVTLSTDTKG